MAAPNNSTASDDEGKGLPDQAALAAKYSCTSCREGQGIELLHSRHAEGRCVPCDSSCKDCALGNDPNACTTCKGEDALRILDASSQGGVCSNKTSSSCPDCVPRVNATCVAVTGDDAGRVFIPTELHPLKPELDLGICKAYTGDCVSTCAPDDDAAGIPKRRECTKFCFQKVSKRTASGDKKLVVCRMRKSVTCEREEIGGAEETAKELEGELKESAEEVNERCKVEKHAECAAAMPWSEAKNSQDSHTIMIEAGLNSTASAPGCSELGGHLASLQICESALLMF